MSLMMSVGDELSVTSETGKPTSLKTIHDVGKRRVLGGNANRVQRVCERQQRRDLVLVADRALQIVEGVGDSLLPAVAQCVGELRLVDVGDSPKVVGTLAGP